MQATITFNTVLEDIEKLSLEEQESLLDLMDKRIKAKRRSELIRESQQAYNEFKEGKAKSVEPGELMNEILS